MKGDKKSAQKVLKTKRLEIKGLRKTVFAFTLLVVSIFAIYSAFFLYQTNKNLKARETRMVEVQKYLDIASNPEKQREVLDEEAARVVAAVGKLMVLPVDESPSVSVILDIDALVAEQSFYQGAHNGDRILIYRNTRQGIVYDPVNDIIVKVGILADEKVLDESIAEIPKE